MDIEERIAIKVIAYTIVATIIGAGSMLYLIHLREQQISKDMVGEVDRGYYTEQIPFKKDQTHK